MLHFEGDNDFVQAPAAVWFRLTDLKFLIGCIPDVQSSTLQSPTEATLVIQPGFSFIRGHLNIAVKVVEAVANQTLKLHVHGKGIGSSNDVDLVMIFASQDSGTRIHWTADITNMTGLLRAMPKGLLQASAQKVIGDVWASVQTKLGA